MIKLADELSSGDHVCALTESEEHLSELSAHFVAGGLERNEKVFFFDDDGTADAMLRRLVEDGGPVEEPLRTGQLAIVPEEQTRATFQTPLGPLYREVFGTVDSAMQEGWDGCRLTGQMHSANAPGATATHAEFDGLLDRIVQDHGRLTALCTYDQTRYTAEQIEIMRVLHKDHLARTGAYDDNLLRLVRTGATSARLAGEVDHSNRPQIVAWLRSALDRSLRAPEAPPVVELDMASVRFVDVATAVSLIHAAETFPATHRLVLNRVRPRVQRVLDRCGASFAAQLAIDDHAPGAPDTGETETS